MSPLQHYSQHSTNPGRLYTLGFNSDDVTTISGTWNVHEGMTPGEDNTLNSPSQQLSRRPWHEQVAGCGEQLYFVAGHPHADGGYRRECYSV